MQLLILSLGSANLAGSIPLLYCFLFRNADLTLPQVAAIATVVLLAGF